MVNNPESISLHLVDRKLDLLVKELMRYGVSVAAIQETKWFGKDVWQADGHTFLHSGRPLPSDGEPAVRNEGLAFFWMRGQQQPGRRLGKSGMLLALVWLLLG